MSIRRDILVATIQELKDARFRMLEHQRGIEEEIKALDVTLDRVERWLRIEDA